MDLLIKTVINTENPKMDNSDKRSLFAVHSIKSAQDYQKEWGFIKECNFDAKSKSLDNIAYHLQYIDFLIHLYNEYQIYLTVEALLFKDIIVNCFIVTECVIDDIIHQRGLRERLDKYLAESQSCFYSEVQLLADQGIINNDLLQMLDWLRQQRNNLHLPSVGSAELLNYSIDDANRAIKIIKLLNKLGPRMSGN